MTFSPKQKKDILRAACGFAAAAAAAAALIYFGHRNDAVNEAERLKAGVLTAHQVHAAFQDVGGRITARPAEESERVKPGELLMSLDPTDTDIAIRSTEAQIRALDAQIAFESGSIELALETAATNEKTIWRQIEAAEAERRAAAAALENARLEFARAKELYPKGAVSKSVFDAAQAGWISAKSALAAAERALDERSVGASAEAKAALRRTGSAEGMALETIANARAEAENRRYSVANLEASRDELRAALEQLRVTKTRLSLKAPQAGKILEVLFEEGDIISPGAPAVLLETDRLYFDIYVSEAQAAAFAPGKAVEAWSPALRRAVPGKVRFCEAAPDFANLRMTRERGQADLTLFRVRIDVEPQAGLLTGMTLEVKTL